MTTTIPDDTEWDGNDEVAVPGGHALTCAIKDGLSASTESCETPNQRSFYGWEFTFRFNGHPFITVIQATDSWLLICEPEGKADETTTTTVLELLNRIITSDTRFSDIKWHFRKDYEQGDESKGANKPVT
jgi:hypothetical protein